MVLRENKTQEIQEVQEVIVEHSDFSFLSNLNLSSFWADLFSGYSSNSSLMDIISTKKPDSPGKPPKDEPLPPPPPPEEGSQWHLDNATGVDINVQTAWQDYTGQGVTVGIFDDGVEYSHYELSANYNSAIDEDILQNTNDGSHKLSSDAHGTTVAGVIASANDGTGTTGVAYDADITSFRVLGSSSESVDGQIADIIQGIEAGAKVDISNNSWGFSNMFGESSIATQIDTALEYGVTQGRNGLGTVYVYSSGNSGDTGDNANYSEMLNSRFTIAVGATDSDGVLTNFSTPGAPVLVVAPGLDIYTTDRVGSSGFDAGDFVSVSGTSFSAPMVSGITALMLEANSELGYRDVQEIFAYSAIQTDSGNSAWGFNGASNWNGGGLHVSDGYGFGFVDATAAVRLAETWDVSSPSVLANESSATFNSDPVANGSLDRSTVTSSIFVSSSMNIEHVEVQLDLGHNKIGDLVISLMSPDGTESVLLNRPGNGNLNLGYDSSWSLSSTHSWGESGSGEWVLSVQDLGKGKQGVGSFTDWSLTLYGDAFSNDDTYIYTNEFANFNGDASRSLLQDANGTDTINASTISSNSVIDLTPGSVSTLAGNALNLGSETLIENAYAGDGDDMLIGNLADNQLSGGRGSDTYLGFSADFGNDIIFDYSGVNDLLDLSNYISSDIVSWVTLDSDLNSFADQLMMSFTNGASITIDAYFDNAIAELSGDGLLESINFSDDSFSFSEVQVLAT